MSVNNTPNMLNITLIDLRDTVDSYRKVYESRIVNCYNNASVEGSPHSLPSNCAPRSVSDEILPRLKQEDELSLARTVGGSAPIIIILMLVRQPLSSIMCILSKISRSCEISHWSKRQRFKPPQTITMVLQLAIFNAPFLRSPMSISNNCFAT